MVVFVIIVFVFVFVFVVIVVLVVIVFTKNYLHTHHHPPWGIAWLQRLLPRMLEDRCYSCLCCHCRCLCCRCLRCGCLRCHCCCLCCHCCCLCCHCLWLKTLFTPIIIIIVKVYCLTATTSSKNARGAAIFAADWDRCCCFSSILPLLPFINASTAAFL